MRVILHIFHCACAIRSYFYFRSKIWRHCGVPRSQKFRRFAYTFKADIGLLILHGFSGPLGLKWWLGQNGGRDGVMLTPTNSFLLLGVLTYVPILVKIDQEMPPWECAHNTDKTTDRQPKVHHLSFSYCCKNSVSLGFVNFHSIAISIMFRPNESYVLITSY